MSGWKIELAESNHSAARQQPNASAPSASPLPIPNLIALHYSGSNAATLTAAEGPQHILPVLRAPHTADAQVAHKLKRTSAKRWHAYAQEAVRNVKGLAHPLAHVRYKAPVHSIKSLAGLRQHIAHYLHLYNTGLWLCLHH